MTVTTAWDFIAVGVLAMVLGIAWLNVLEWRTKLSTPLSLLLIGAILAFAGVARFADWL